VRKREQKKVEVVDGQIVKQAANALKKGEKKSPILGQ
jgi:hypothetical protein